MNKFKPLTSISFTAITSATISLNMLAARSALIDPWLRQTTFLRCPTANDTIAGTHAQGQILPTAKIFSIPP
jgi:hypothetical protein